MPVREIPVDLMGLDIGPATVHQFATALKGAGTVVWNGPMGVFEKAPFAAGTVGVGRAVADAAASPSSGAATPSPPCRRRA